MKTIINKWKKFYLAKNQTKDTAIVCYIMGVKSNTNQFEINSFVKLNVLIIQMQNNLCVRWPTPPKQKSVHLTKSGPRNPNKSVHRKKTCTLENAKNQEDFCCLNTFIGWHFEIKESAISWLNIFMPRQTNIHVSQRNHLIAW